MLTRIRGTKGVQVCASHQETKVEIESSAKDRLGGRLHGLIQAVERQRLR